LLGISETTNDLYLDTNGYIGYYKLLRRINTERDLYIEEQSGLLKDIAEHTAQYQTYSVAVAEAEEQLRDKQAFFKSLCGKTFEQLMDDQENEWWDNGQVITTASAIGRLKTLIVN
jgi:hypothetical protein